MVSVVFLRGSLVGVVVALPDPAAETVMTAAVALPWPDVPGRTVRFPLLPPEPLTVVLPSRHLAENGPTVVPPTRTLATVASAIPAPALTLIPLATTAPDLVETDPPPVLTAPPLDTVGCVARDSAPLTEMPLAAEMVSACAGVRHEVVPAARNAPMLRPVSMMRALTRWKVVVVMVGSFCR
ncbi:hypothetical protein CFP75_38410 [Amycolatopsis alba DSM 44262]|uniref:Uncharacterized protein n=1 Tax=Amycolatopsis alba DSM 44262 TaxID=1125972 RepID=A0A229RAH2_AMYAL|nr:hypothetical protein CFP75_38410 [Amycolatopsis alba DSM 44262]